MSEEYIIEIAENAAFLCLENNRLKILQKAECVAEVSIKDISVLILSNPAVTITGALLAALSKESAITILSDEKRMPAGMVLPLEGNYIQTERFLAQAESTQPLKKRLWQKIVRVKIERQANLLQTHKAKDSGLKELSKLVSSGDSGNLEGRAAKIYWKALFGPGFLRDRNAGGINAGLNYGYAILRAMTARAVCAAGLHPTLGINHHNRYNPFCLADDLMEPFRPIVDEYILRQESVLSGMSLLEQSIRKEILAELNLKKVQTSDGAWKLRDLLTKAASSLAQSFQSGKMDLKLPWD